MQTQSPPWNRLVVPVLFAVVCTLATLFVWRDFGGTTPLEPQGYRFAVTIPQAANLQSGAAVTSAGVRIGHVVGVRRDGAGARVVAEVERAYAPIHADARVIPRTRSLLGEAYLEMSLGSADGAPTVPDGGSLARAQVDETQRLDDLLSTFDPQTRAQFRRFLSGWAAGVRGRGEALNDALGWSAPATSGFAEVFTELDRQRAQLGTLVDRGGEMLGAVGRREGALQAAVREGDRLFAVTAQRRRDITAAVRALPPFLHQLTETASAADAASGDLARAAGSLEPVAPLLDPAVADVAQLAPDARTLFKRLPPVIKAGRRGLPATEDILRELPPALRSLHAGGRAIVPSLQFLALDPALVTSPAASLASLGNAYIFGPGRQKLHYARAIPLLWNELLGGLEKPLPSSRQNPYPKPGSLGDLAEGGLSAWSCSNLKNAPVVPVIPPGTGAPPCKVQGPWTFNGVSAFYPRLLPAAP